MLDDAKCDVWSVGVIAFMLLSGAPPFVGNTDTELFVSIKAGQWQFDEALLHINTVSPDAREFIRRCLDKRVSKRLSASEALKHRWFDVLKTTAVQVPPSPILLQRFSAFIVRSWLAKIFIDVLSHTLLPTSITDLRVQFNKFDLSGSGQISIEDLRSITQNYTRSLHNNSPASNTPQDTSRNNSPNPRGATTNALALTTDDNNLNNSNSEVADYQEEFLNLLLHNMNIDQTGSTDSLSV